MSNLMNYLQCLKCNSSSNILQINYNNKVNDIFLKLSCVKKCSVNYIKLSELIETTKIQNKIPISILAYGNYIKEQSKIETFSEKILSFYNQFYLDIENIEKNLMIFKEEIKNEINKTKNTIDKLIILNEYIFGGYLKILQDNLDKDNKDYLKNNLKFININSSNIFNNKNRLYKKEIEKDIENLNNIITYLKKEFSLFIKENALNPINLFPASNNIQIQTFHKKQKHNIIETINTKIKDIKSIIQLSDGNLALGSDIQLSIYNLEINKEINDIPGEFSDIREIKYNKLYKSGKNQNIIILSLLKNKIRIYDINEKKMILNFVQNSEIDNVLELYNGDILYINDFSIYNINLNKEFKIPLSFFCFSMINLYDKPEILGYTTQKYIKFIYLDKTYKEYSKLEVKEAEEIFDIKQLYDKNKNYNYLIILSPIYLDLYDFNKKVFYFRYFLKNENLYRKINLYLNDNEELCYILSLNSIKLFIVEDNKLLNYQTISDLKNIQTNALIYTKTITTPFCLSNSGKYILISKSNDDGFNII